MREPWECPRCHRINAPWNPACFCRKEEETSLEKFIRDPANQMPIKSIERCMICNGHHGIGIQCIQLRHMS